MRKINLYLGNVLQSEILVYIAVSLIFADKQKKPQTPKPDCIELLIFESNKLYNLYTEKDITKFFKPQAQEILKANNDIQYLKVVLYFQSAKKQVFKKISGLSTKF